MRKRVYGTASVLVLLIAGYAVYSTFSARSVSMAAVSSLPKSPNTVSAEGIVVPVQHTTLASKTGGRVIEILVNEGEEVTAGTPLMRLDDVTLQAQVSQAKAALNVAEKQLAQLRAGGTAADRQAASEAVTAARAQYEKVKAGPTADELAQLKANLDGAQAALSQAQFRYDRIGGASNPFGTAAPESLALQQAFISLASAQAAYRSALSHPTESELRAAESAVALSVSAQAKLDATPEAIALAEAQVDQAQAALDLAKTAARDAVLVAPFGGTIAAVMIDVGQVVAPGTPVMTLGDLSQFRVETTDLAETDAARVAEGQAVKVTLDALPDLVLNGRVARIAPMASDHAGDQVFKVTIELPETPGFRWGMTVNVEMGTGR